MDLNGKITIAFEQACQELRVFVHQFVDALFKIQGEAIDVIDDVGLPAIIRPAFTLGGTGGGVAYNRETGPDRGYSLALTSSHGLGDNSDASYAQLVDINAEGKGVFVRSSNVVRARIVQSVWR